MWEYVELFYDQLYNICLRAAKYDRDLADELMSDVVYERLPRILELWDRDKGPINNYVNCNIKLYVFKHIQKQHKTDKLFEYSEVDDYYYSNHEAIVEVLTILDTLTEYERSLIWSHLALGISCRQLSQTLDIPRSALTRQLKDILEKIRRAFPSAID